MRGLSSTLAIVVLLLGCDGFPASRDPGGEGLEVHRRTVAERGPAGASEVVLAHFDPARFELVLLTAARDGDGETRRLEEWVDDFGLVAAINASMYLPNLRSTGLMIDGDHLNNPAVNPSFSGFLAFGALDSSVAPVEVTGDDCPGFDIKWLRAHYRALVQSYRLLDCEGDAIEWQDRKQYSSAAVGLDDRGWLVFAHSGSPCRTSDFARWLAQEGWGVAAALFVEGGNEASLLVDDGRIRSVVTGGYEGVYRPAARSRAVPNVLGVRRREP